MRLACGSTHRLEVTPTQMYFRVCDILPLCLLSCSLTFLEAGVYILR